ncbi:MAG TPA: nitrogenase cofactor biosynthesis protein NifB, partial [Anaerovoracaceae bacterium]|nr:nitrogenase cofactor biosynthesis protein NifB [Anaerovoracaceae bacterium]
LYDKYYTGDKAADPEEKAPAFSEKTVDTAAALIAEKTKTHPCFSGCAGNYARIHLPVAKKCNIQCNYCLRKFDCPNESRPGITTKLLTPEEALEKYFRVKAELSNLKVVGIAGPGDALAEFEHTKKTLRLIRAEDPDVTFCLSTNGLLLPQFADDLSGLGVSHVTVTVNAVDPKIGAKIYQRVDHMGMTYTGETGAAILLANQLTGIKMLQDRGIVCKVNIVMLKGINDGHIPEVVKKVKEQGCSITNIMQMIPVKGSAFENMPLTSNVEIMEMRQKCGTLLDQMYHCRQCRADAVGTLGNDESARFEENSGGEYKKMPERHEKTLLFAVASKGGMLVDQHFGHVSDFYIYEYRAGAVKFKERRGVPKYCGGPEDCGGTGDGTGSGMLSKEDKMEKIFGTIGDCGCVIAMRAGEAPKKRLAEKGIRFLSYYGKIEEAVAEAAATVLNEKENKKEAIS